jgi:hypothetical protein
MIYDVSGQRPDKVAPELEFDDDNFKMAYVAATGYDNAV